MEHGHRALEAWIGQIRINASDTGGITMPLKTMVLAERLGT